MDEARCPVCGEPMTVVVEREHGREAADGVREPETMRVGKVCSNVNCASNNTDLAPAAEDQDWRA